MTLINSRAIAMIRYSVRIIKWKKDEVRTKDRKTRKTMTMHRALHPRAPVDRLYIPINNGGRGMISAKNCAKLKTESLN